MAYNAGAQLSAEGKLNLRNVLDGSRSPYVRGHMNNPVAWQMWGPEAIDLAKRSNRLMFVSIGYAACHWCHVMERESFENAEIAKLLNKHFIPIKVDREERPDVDRIYMNYVQATTGHGGWPLNVFITPDLQPVFGGTYWPGPEASNERIGMQVSFLDVLGRIANVWETQQERCLVSAKSVTAQLQEFAQEGSNASAQAAMQDDQEAFDLELLEEAYEHFNNKYDRQFGGFGSAPKFPTPANLSFLLSLGQYSSAVQDVVGHDECKKAKAMVLHTLRNMSRGGLHDQIGNGFARYSVTRDWSLPHFEKMLYDQAQLLSVYLDAFLVSGDAEMLGAVYDIVTYLTSPPLAATSGGFYSSEDADSYYAEGDSEKREGAFYVWTEKELQTILQERDADILSRFYNVSAHGNVSPEHDAHDELINQNVLAVSTTPDALAKDLGMTREEVIDAIKRGKTKLLEHRDTHRPRPDLDDKIVVAWNGLAIGALARTSAVLGSVDTAKSQLCRKAAVEAVTFITSTLLDESTGMLKRVFRDGPGDAPAFADDYAFFIQGLLELYEATFDDQYLKLADSLQRTQIDLFWDDIHGAFFSTRIDQPDTLLRLKDGMDGAEPSTNGVAATNLYRLSALLEDTSYASLAARTCAAFALEAAQHPFLFGSMVPALVAGRLGMRSVVITGSGADVEQAVDKVRCKVNMGTVIIRLGGEAKAEWLRAKNDVVSVLDPERSRVQVCAGGVCRDDFALADIEKALKEVV